MKNLFFSLILGFILFSCSFHSDQEKTVIAMKSVLGEPSSEDISNPHNNVYQWTKIDASKLPDIKGLIDKTLNILPSKSEELQHSYQGLYDEKIYQAPKYEIILEIDYDQRDVTVKLFIDNK